MKHKISHSLYSYWNEIRGQRVAPRRFEIEPSRIASILPDTFILDCERHGSPRFRLAGTRMSNLLGRDVRDGDFLDLFQARDHKTLQHVLQLTITQAGVSLLTTEPVLDAAPGISSHPQIEIMLLPLFHTEAAVTRLLGCAVPLEPLVSLKPLAFLPQSLVSHETIWPDGRPHAVLQQLSRQSPFAPEQRGSRIVSSDRRRFRVFDGGKTT
jgi:hypothetical protein